MKREQMIILVLSVVMAIVLTFIIYKAFLKKKGQGSTANSQTVQQIVDKALPGEQNLAKQNVDYYKDNFNENFTEEAANILLGYTDSALAWAATYYKEQTGRSLYVDIDNLPYWGWSSFSTVDGKLMSRLSKLGIE